MKTIAEARIKTDKISADILATFSVPTCYRGLTLPASRGGNSRTSEATDVLCPGADQISHNNSTVKELAKRNARAELLQSIPGAN